MKWQLAARVALLLAPPLAMALRDGKLSREEAAALVALLVEAALPDSRRSGS